MVPVFNVEPKVDMEILVVVIMEDTVRLPGLPPQRLQFYRFREFQNSLLSFYLLLFDIALICARTSRAAKKYPTNMLVMEIIEMSSIFKCCHIFRTVQSPSAHNTFNSMFL